MILEKEKLIFQIDTEATVIMFPEKYKKHIILYQGVLTMWNK